VMGAVQPASQRQSSFSIAGRQEAGKIGRRQSHGLMGAGPELAVQLRVASPEVRFANRLASGGREAPGLSAPGLPALKATWTPFRAIEWSLGSRSRFSPPSARLGLPPPPFTRSSPFGASLKIGRTFSLPTLVGRRSSDAGTRRNDFINLSLVSIAGRRLSSTAHPLAAGRTGGLVEARSQAEAALAGYAALRSDGGGCPDDW
jgi:hypothetical protein